MAQQTINIGSSANDGTGDPLRTAFDKINDNFTELYGSSPFGTIISLSGNTISTNQSNADLVLRGNGTGGVVADSIKFSGTTISSDDSTSIQVNENFDVDGNITASGNITATGNIFAKGNINLGDAASDQTKVIGVFEADNIQIDGTTITTNTTNGSVTITGNGTGGVNIDNLTFNDNSITSSSNADINLTPGGTGGVVAGGVRINGTSLSADDSSTININEGLLVDGTGNFSGTLTTAAISTTGTHTITGQLNADNLRMDGNVISSTDANGNITLTPNGTGSVVASSVKIKGTSISSDDSSLINLNENVNVTGTLTTADITTTGTHTITGTSNVDFVTIKDNEISTNASNANLVVSANGSGVIDIKNAMTTVGQTMTGNLSITGIADIDNIRINGNIISSTNSNGGITIDPSGAGNINLTASNVIVSGELNVEKQTVGNTLFMMPGSKIQPNDTNDDVVLESNGTGSVVLDQVSITDNIINTHVTNADLVLTTDGTGTIELRKSTTVTGTLTATSITTNELISNGSNATFTVSSSGTGDVKLDAGGDIILDADNADIKLEDGGVEFGRISRVTSDLVIKSMGNNNDMLFKGVDDTATITALTLDMSAAGAATFNSTVTATDITANSLTTNVITSNGSNAELSLQPSGTGDVLISALRVNGTTLDSSDSTKITIAEAVDVTGVLTASTSIETPTITRTGSFTIDASSFIILDADGGEVFLRDGSAGNYGSLIRNGSNDLTISSGPSQALIFTGANAAFQGNISVAGSSTLDGVTITDNTITANASNADLQLGTAGTGVIDILTSTQSTVGSAGGASALPGQPTGYIKIKIGGTLRVIPFYDQA